MDDIASNVLTVLIEENMIFTIFIILINLPLYYVFQLSSTCLVSLQSKVESEIGSLGKFKKKENNNFQHYNILSAH
jgi:hypothetical protein